jgi:hypothetical protein
MLRPVLRPVLRAMIDLAEPPVCHQAALLLPYAIVRFGQ